ncbi:hypothetical protein D3C72_2167410 [compost metagenome]
MQVVSALQRVMAGKQEAWLAGIRLRLEMSSQRHEGSIHIWNGAERLAIGYTTPLPWF